MLTFLRGYAIAVIQDAASGSPSDVGPPVGGENLVRDLRGVSEVMSRTPVLVQAMTDEMVPVNARRAGANVSGGSTIPCPKKYAHR